MLSGTSRVAAGNTTQIRYILKSHSPKNQAVGLFARVPSGQLPHLGSNHGLIRIVFEAVDSPAFSEEPWFFQT
jgi:hypothetical protein